MEKSKKEFYNDEAKIEIEINKQLTDGLERFDTFLSWIDSNHPELYNQIILDLENRWEIGNILIFPPQFTSSRFQKHANLFKKASNELLDKMNYSKYNITNGTQKIKINVKDYLRSRLFFYYTLAQSLLVVLSKEESVNSYQKFIDHTTKLVRDPKNYIEEIDQINQESEKFQQIYQSHNVVQFSLEKGKGGTKVTKCKWYEVMKELNDPEFSYAVCCHYDFEATKNMNPDFVLTRPKTIMQGDEYCDFCYHDKRILKAIVHPSEDFWETL